MSKLNKQIDNKDRLHITQSKPQGTGPRRFTIPEFDETLILSDNLLINSSERSFRQRYLGQPHTIDHDRELVRNITGIVVNYLSGLIGQSIYQDRDNDINELTQARLHNYQQHIEASVREIVVYIIGEVRRADREWR